MSVCQSPDTRGLIATTTFIVRASTNGADRFSLPAT